MGRLVITHSTYINGLIKVLKKMAKIKGIKTITPGVIGQTKGRSELLKIKITSKIQGGYKLLARKGKNVQEVFLITELGETEIKEYIQKII